MALRYYKTPFHVTYDDDKTQEMADAVDTEQGENDNEQKCDLGQVFCLKKS